MQSLKKAAAVFGAAVALSACSVTMHKGNEMSAPAPSAVPSAIAAPAGFATAFTWSALGSQIYACKKDAKGDFAWAFVAPDADLFTNGRTKTGTHGAGPFWKANDGSRIVGTVSARAPGAAASDIPLLLLEVKSDGVPGVLHNVRYIQRLNTLGGVAPATGCKVMADDGKTVNVPYSADYAYITAAR